MNEIEKNDRIFGGSRIGICLSCDRWEALGVCAGGQWEPSCGFLTIAQKCDRGAPGGSVSPNCPRSQEHALLDGKAGWCLGKVEEYALIVGFVESNKRLGDVVIELSPEPRAIFCVGDSWALTREERRSAFCELSVFINKEFERMKSSWRFVYERGRGWFFRTLTHGAIQNPLPPTRPSMVDGGEDGDDDDDTAGYDRVNLE